MTDPDSAREGEGALSGDLMPPPRNGDVIAPDDNKMAHVADIICGHDFIYAWPEAKQEEFYRFVRHVFWTELK